MGEAALSEAPGDDAQPKPDRQPRFELVQAKEMEFREPQFLIAGLIETENFSQIFGDPGYGKSFIAIDIACCVATGRAFHGREMRPGPVIYIAGEGQNGIKRRLIAWERHTGVSRGGAPLYFSRVAAQLLDADSAAAVAEAVDALVARVGPAALIVIDTLARNFGPGDENQTADMSKFVAAVDALMARHGSALLVVHHTATATRRGRAGPWRCTGPWTTNIASKRTARPSPSFAQRLMTARRPTRGPVSDPAVARMVADRATCCL
jgi:RecA-family ATPase